MTAWRAPALICVALLVASCGSSVRETDSSWQISTVHTHLGEVFADGTTVLELPGGRPAFILSIRPARTDPGLTYLGSAILGPHRRFTTSTTMAWPHPRARRVEGFHAEPAGTTWHKQGYQILLGYRVEDDSYATSVNVVVTYWMGGRTHIQVLNSVFASCPRPLKIGRCSHRAQAENHL